MECHNCCWGEAKPDMFKFGEDELKDESEDSGFMYDWEVTVDCTLKCPHGSFVGALFSRVYIDDSDLVNKGADDRVARLIKQMSDLKVRENPQRKKFLAKLSKLGFVSGFSPMFNAESSAKSEYEPVREQVRRSVKFSPNSSTSSSRGSPSIPDVDFTEVEFKEYTSSFGKKLFKYKLQHSVSQSSISPPLTSNSPATSPVPHSNSADTSLDDSSQPSSHSSSSTPPLIKNSWDGPPETSVDDEGMFNFLRWRDSHLVAKEANKYMNDDKEVMKYWFQRYRLFSKLNEGILMDRESWFSVTPERLAEHIADRIVRKKGTVILDAFTGAGGNAIQFARRGAFVYAIDLDPVKLRCAMFNAKVYGVEDRISFICADFFDFAKGMIGSRRPLRRLRDGEKAFHYTPLKRDPLAAPADNPYGIDAVFLSPPWGGPAYLQSREFDLERDMEPTRGSYIFRVAKEISPNICYFLPRNTSVKQLIGLEDRVEIEQAVLNGKVKTICAYYGNLGAFE